MLFVDVYLLNCVWLFAASWTVAHQALLSMGFPRQEYWSGLPFTSPGESSRSRDRTQVSCIAGRCFNLWATREANILYKNNVNVSSLFVFQNILFTVLLGDVRWYSVYLMDEMRWMTQVLWHSIRLFTFLLKESTLWLLFSICQQIWKTQQRPQDWKRSVFIPIPKKGSVLKLEHNCIHLTHQ